MSSSFLDTVAVLFVNIPVETGTFEKFERKHREERHRDAERMRIGDVTPEQLKEENSLFSADAKITFDLVG